MDERWKRGKADAKGGRQGECYDGHFNRAREATCISMGSLHFNKRTQLPIQEGEKTPRLRRKRLDNDQHPEGGWA